MPQPAAPPAAPPAPSATGLLDSLIPARPAHKYNDLRSPLATVSVCNLNQWALDFAGNKQRIIESIKLCKNAGAKYRLGPELEICGYSCEDHFYEMETMDFSWKILGELLEEGHTNDILVDFGMPIIHHGVRYNCRVFCLAGKILLIRPKMWLAEDGNYREGRWFTGWHKDKLDVLEDHVLPDEIQEITKQKSVKFGVGIIETSDATIASEVCEELFTPESLNILLGLEGVDIISNGSGSHFQIGKQQRRHALIKEATKKNGGVYMYSNLLGCDGNRLVFDGNGMIYKNAQLLAVGEHLSFQEVEIVTATINLNDVRTSRASVVSRGIQSDQRSVRLQRINLAEMFKGVQGVEDFHLASTTRTDFKVTDPIKVPSYEMEYEMGLCASRYLWDYLIRSGVFGGLFLPLSGGVDSSSTAMIVFMMCEIIVNIVNNKKDETIYDPKTDEDRTRLRTLIVNRLKERVLLNYPDYVKEGDVTDLTDARQLMYVILHTCNMPTKNNTAEIKGNAELLAQSLGCFHTTAPIEDAFVSMKNMAKRIEFFNFKGALPPSLAAEESLVPAEWTPPATNTVAAPAQAAMRGGRSPTNGGPDPKVADIPRYKLTGGDWQENLAIQNIQARLRMVTAYYLAQILPLYRYNLNKLRDNTVIGMSWSQFIDARDDAIIKAKLDTSNDGKSDEDINFVKYLSEEAKAAHKKLISTRPGANAAPYLLVLASSNADEALRGFFTKYDAGSADLNPIGSFSKTHLRQFLAWIVKKYKDRQYNFDVITAILDTVASPELTPTDEGGAIQDDEIEIEMTYYDLYEFGLYRKDGILGPLGIFKQMCNDKLGKTITVVNTSKKTKEVTAATPTNIAQKVFLMFKWFNTQRHKMTIITPSIHATSYSPDDNRHDERPFLYPSVFTMYQFKYINKLAEEMETRQDVQDLIQKGKVPTSKGGRYSNTRNRRQQKSKTRRQRI